MGTDWPGCSSPCANNKLCNFLFLYYLFLCQLFHHGYYRAKQSVQTPSRAVIDKHASKPLRTISVSVKIDKKRRKSRHTKGQISEKKNTVRNRNKLNRYRTWRLKVLDLNFDELCSLVPNQFGSNYPSKWKLFQVNATVLDERHLHENTALQSSPAAFLRNEFYVRFATRFCDECKIISTLPQYVTKLLRQRILTSSYDVKRHLRLLQ